MESASAQGQINEESMLVDDECSIVEQVLKPRNHFSNSVLRKVVPQTDIRKKKESLSMSMINMGGSGRSGSRLFMSSSFVAKDGENRLQSHNLIAKQISFSSPLSKDIVKAVQVNSKDVSKNQQPIDEENSDDTSEKSDPSSSENSDSDSSIEAALNGEEETEEAIYNKILAAQESRDAGMEGEESKEKENQVEQLVDRNMINLLRVCAMLPKPSPAEIEQRKVVLGPPTHKKLLILDMDETLLHSKFHKLDGTEDKYDAAISEDANGVLEFNILISNKPNQPPSMRLNVKLR